MTAQTDRKQNIDREPALTLEVYTLDEIHKALSESYSAYVLADYDDLVETLRKNHLDLLDEEEKRP